jgi:hypothetical protein
MTKQRGVVCAAAALLLAAAAVVTADDGFGSSDFGLRVERLLQAQSEKWFGVVRPLGQPAGPADYVPRELANASQRLKLAHGLQAKFVTRKLATLGDMIAFWPNAQNPTHLIVCIEGGRNSGGTNPGVQRVSLLQDGKVETILFGMSRCDGIRTTAWGTILATEETGDGRAYEILDPLNTNGHWIESRSTGVIRTGIGGGNPISNNVAQRPALPTMAWEGLAVLPSGVVIGGDELRPGSNGLDSDGGAIFKFVPSSPQVGGPITNLNNSPLVSGNVYALTVSCVGQGSGSFPQYGQGCEIGLGAWVRVDALMATADANAKGATGYYRPEDLHDDPLHEGPGVRFCWTNTGEAGSGNYGEVVCAVDNNPLPATPSEWLDPRTNHLYLADGGSAKANVTTASLNRFFEGDPRFNSVDNLDFQPHTGILYVIEDDDFGEVFACLRDGADRDIKTDGCISILSVVDPNAEPTGFIFDGTGETAYLVIQHGETPAALGATDDLIKITGFKVRQHRRGGSRWDDD